MFWTDIGQIGSASLYRPTGDPMRCMPLKYNPAQLDSSVSTGMKTTRLNLRLGGFMLLASAALMSVPAAASILSLEADNNSRAMSDKDGSSPHSDDGKIVLPIQALPPAQFDAQAQFYAQAQEAFCPRGKNDISFWLLA